MLCRLQAALSTCQLKTLEKYRQRIAESKHGQLQKAVNEALAEDGNVGSVLKWLGIFLLQSMSVCI